MDKNLIGLRDSSWGLADDSSTVLQISNDKTITVAGGTGIGTALSGDTLTITATEAQPVFKTIAVAGQDSVVADATTDTLTLAAGTGMTITTNATSDTITLASSAAGTITALNNQAANRLTTIGSTTTQLDGEANATFDGSTLAITGNITASTTIGATTNITAGGSITAGTTIGTDAITIDDNTISTSRSNDSLQITANGTGRIDVSANGTYLSTSNVHYTKWWGAETRVKGLAVNYVNDSVNANTTDRQYGSAFSVGNTLTASSSSNSNWRPRALIADSSVDMAGQDYTKTGTSRGPQGFLSSARAYNSSGSSASQISSVRGIEGNAAIADFANPGQNITIDNATGIMGVVAIEGNGTSDMLISTGKAITANAYTDYGGSGSATITDFYAFHTGGTGGTNNYAFVTDSATAVSKIGTLAQYRESIHALTSSSTIAVDANLAPVHTVTLGVSTQFAVSNLATGQSITLIITQDGTGSRTASFSEGDSTAVKFAGGSKTLSTAANAIDVVTIFNDGTQYIANLALAYAA